MATIIGTIPTPGATSASRAIVRFEALGATPGLRTVAAATLADTGVVLSAGRWLVTWWNGPVPGRMLIDVPAGNGTFQLNDLVGDRGAAVIYWGSSILPTLNATQAEALQANAIRTTFAGTFSFPVAGYKYLIWPNAWGPFAQISDASNGFAVSMAGPAEGYTSQDGAASYLPIIIGGLVYRIHRTRHDLSGATSFLLSA